MEFKWNVHLLQLKCLEHVIKVQNIWTCCAQCKEIPGLLEIIIWQMLFRWQVMNVLIEHLEWKFFGKDSAVLNVIAQLFLHVSWNKIWRYRWLRSLAQTMPAMCYLFCTTRLQASTTFSWNTNLRHYGADFCLLRFLEGTNIQHPAKVNLKQDRLYQTRNRPVDRI